MRQLLLRTTAVLILASGVPAGETVLLPQIDGEFWQVAEDPDLGKYTTAKQQPVDFGIWQAADGTWQLWSCIRSTSAPGKTRLFHRWQAAKLTDKDWVPMGIAMMADPNFGETARTSKDMIHWSAPHRVAYVGSAGNGKYSAECPFVYYHKPSGYYYLLRTQSYGERARSTIYRSKNPLDFGKDNDPYMVGVMPYAAPEIIESEGGTYIAVLLPNLKGIQIARLKFAPKP
jgi:hypothetical protein